MESDHIMLPDNQVVIAMKKNGRIEVYEFFQLPDETVTKEIFELLIHKSVDKIKEAAYSQP